ncbi:protein-disulfide reductase DsbD domain-containing protein [Asaia prunellae]|uniref:protein-disulfide reductase DsbD domain-containing protein n=1 Tax=Asaia prunellae TaxID=610245 RepID=UPI000A5FA1C5|nr:protein-disulfide reductase DsbD domain-containing protein [Asaia prunellae]
MTSMARPWGGRQFSSNDAIGLMLRKLFFLVLLLSSFGHVPVFAAESDPVVSSHDTATLVTDRDSVEAGATLHVGLRLQLKPGWHTYWLNAGDAGEPPTLKVTASGALTGQSERIDFPTPVRISEGGLMSYAYTGDVLLPQALKLEGQGGAVTLKLTPNGLSARQPAYPSKAISRLICQRATPRQTVLPRPRFLSMQPSPARYRRLLRRLLQRMGYSV